MKPVINEIELVVHCHATENCNKVLKALLNVLPPTIRERVKPFTVEYQGHYGNIIRVMTLKLVGKDAEDTIRYIGEQIEETDRSIINVTFDLRYDRRSNKFYLRLDKQAAYKGRLVISDGDDIIKVIISFKGPRRIDSVRDLLREYGMVKSL